MPLLEKTPPPMQSEPPSAVRKRCGAKTRNGGTCKTWGMANGRCRMHGGGSSKSNSGVLNGSYKHGRYSKYNNLGKYAKAFEKQRNNPDALVQLDQIAALSLRADELLTKLGESAEIPDFSTLLDAWNKFRVASASKDPKRINEALERLGIIIEEGAAHLHGWDQYSKTVDNQRKLIESERKRAVEQMEMVKAVYALTAIDAMKNAIVEAVQTHVSDKTERRKVLISAQSAYTAAIGT